jgi:pSer/pThr/pTyr-binding forkhead associated (FHA) protein
MAGAPRVQLSLKGRVLSEVPFSGELLRIGRMKENDVVVNNLAVSRFHATLKRMGDGFQIEDLGSENGTLLNGQRVKGSAAVGEGDVIQLGKYELRLLGGSGSGAQAAPVPPAPSRNASDAWDSSQTYFQPAVPTASPRSPEPLRDAPDPDGVFAFDDNDLAEAGDVAPSAPAPRTPAAVADEPLTDPLPAPKPSLEHTALFEFGSPGEMVAPAPPAPVVEESEEPAELHAGLIVQRDGKLHELRPWDKSQLLAGRAPECELVLADAGVSRRHALFTRVGDAFEVRDLDSVNGVYVNGQRVKQHPLSVGDVVRIEGFELTFVLDHQPMGAEVCGPSPVRVVAATDGARATQFSLAAAPQPEEPFELVPIEGDPNEAPLLSAGGPAAAPTVVTATQMHPLPVADLVLTPDMDEEAKEEARVAASASVSAPSASSAALLEPAVPIRVELALDPAKLPTRLRQALALLGEEGLEVPATLSIRLAEK